jgi:hypothetical protein
MAADGNNVTSFAGSMSGAWSAQSADITADGMAQAFTHGLPVTPDRAWVEVLRGNDGMGNVGTNYPTITPGAITSTTITYTVTAGSIYRVHCY